MLDIIEMPSGVAEISALITGIATVLLVLVGVGAYRLDKEKGKLVDRLNRLQELKL